MSVLVTLSYGHLLPTTSLCYLLYTSTTECRFCLFVCLLGWIFYAHTQHCIQLKCFNKIFWSIVCNSAAFYGWQISFTSAHYGVLEFGFCTWQRGSLRGSFCQRFSSVLLCLGRTHPLRGWYFPTRHALWLGTERRPCWYGLETQKAASAFNRTCGYLMSGT